MKALLIILPFLTLYSCNSKSNTNTTRKDSILNEKSDTTVAGLLLSQDILGTEYYQKEYFVIMKNDTSSFSCVITENKISGKMSMRYWETPYQKIATSYSSKDTAAVAEHEFVKKFNHKSTYKDQIRELKLILKFASKDFNLSKLSSMSMDMSSIDGLSLNILEKYGSQFGTINFRSSQKVAMLIENSFFKTDLNYILSTYSVMINKTFIDDLMYDVPLNSKTGSKAVLDGMIILDLAAVSR